MDTTRTRRLLSALLITSLTTYFTSPLAHIATFGQVDAVPVSPSTFLTQPPSVEPEAPFIAFKRTITTEEPVHALIKRLLPAQYHDHFVFTLNPELVPASSTNVHDTFRLSNTNSSKTSIEGATLAGLGAGLNYYIRNVCQVEMSWSGDRFKDMPAVPPTIANPDSVIRASFVPWRYYMNVVTFGYSFAFWDWKRWERELDWMFLNGINMALAMTGQEYVFRRMYEDLGLTREELNGFFGGPAYMPWQRMGNIQGSWIIPNDTQYKNDWIDSQWELQGQIMKRIREFNMTAILPSFHGFVPRELVSKYPNTTFGRSSQWKGLSDPYSRVRFIPSMDPLFASLTQRFLQLQSTMYEEQGLGYQGDRHFYLLDLYNEIQPMSLEPDHLRTTTYEVMKSLKDADPKAVWTMQSWFLLDRNIWKTNETKAFFNGILDMNHGQDAFVIDLHSEVVPLWKETHGFFGIDWGWSMLNNFGGGHGLYGTLPIVLTEPFKGYQQASRTMQGMGITMEAINNNEYMYQIVLDIPWESAEATIPSVAVDAIHTIIHPKRQRLNQPPLDGQAHFRAYLKRRYGPKQTSEAMIEAWTTLSRTVWDCRTGQMKQSKSKLEAIPSLDISSHKFWYNQTKVVESWNTLVRSTETERSKERRGHGIIQNAIDYALRTASGHPIRDLWGSDNQILSERRKETTLRSNHTRSILGTIFAWMNGSGKSFPQSIFSSPKRLSTQQLPKEADLPLNVSSFRYDLVDVTREVMVAIVIPGIHQELIDAYSAKDLDQTRFLGTLLLNAINDTDKILATHTSFMLGPWIRDARTSARIATSSHSTTTTGLSKSLPSQEQGAGSSYMDGYADYLEQSARTLITWWGNEGQASLADYASKHWAGLVQDFYYPRWKIFVDHLVNAVNHSKELDSMALKKELLRIESKWLKLKTCLGAGCHHCSEKGAESGNRRQDYKLNPTEDTTEVAQDLWDRWAHAATRLVQKAEGAKLTHA